MYTRIYTSFSSYSWDFVSKSLLLWTVVSQLIFRVFVYLLFLTYYRKMFGLRLGTLEWLYGLLCFVDMASGIDVERELSEEGEIKSYWLMSFTLSRPHARVDVNGRPG